MDKKHILIVEDDPDIALIEESYLQAAGFATCIAEDGAQALKLIGEGGFDLLLLDVMLPEKSGFDICRMVRDEVDVPILMVSARTESIDKVRGLGYGADDYIAKPFDPAELVARVVANLRQFDRQRSPSSEESEFREEDICIQDLRICPSSWKVFRGEEELRLANKEFELLRFLATNPDIVFSKELLYEKVWGYDHVGDTSTVMVHVNRIREKIEQDPKNPTIIETIWGIGYRLNRRKPD